MMASARRMTQGSPLRLILFFMVPFLIGNIFQQLYGIADAAIVGQFLGVNAFAGVNVALVAMFVLLSFSIGLGGGFTIVLAQRFGAKSKVGVRKCVTTSIYFAVVVSIFITVIGIFLAEPILHIMNTPSEVFDVAHEFMILSCIGVPSLIAYNLFAGMLKGIGDSKTALYFLIFVAVLNVLLDYFGVVTLNMGVAGAAWATTLSQVISSVLCAIYMFRKYEFLRPRKRDWKISRLYVLKYIKIALPMAIEFSITTIGIMFLQSAVNNFGTDTVAGYSAAMKIESILIVSFISLASAVSTYVAQNLGAKRYERIVRGVKVNLVVGMAMCFVCGLFMFLFWDQSVGLFIGGVNDEAYFAARQYINIAIFNYPILCLLMTFRAIIQALGRTLTPILGGFSEILMRSIGAHILASLFGYVGVCCAAVLSWYIACLIIMSSYIFTICRLKKRLEEKNIMKKC